MLWSNVLTVKSNNKKISTSYPVSRDHPKESRNVVLKDHIFGLPWVDSWDRLVVSKSDQNEDILIN